MSIPATPTRGTVATGALPTDVSYTSVTERILVDEISEEDDKTYIVSGDESAGSEEDTDYESEADFDLDEEFISKNLGDSVTLVDESYIALKEEDNTGTKSHRSEVSKFLLKHEIPRKVFHSAQGLVTIYLYTCGFSQYQIARPLWAMFWGTFTFELARLNIPQVNQAVLPMVKYLIRPSERHSWNGIVFYLAGVSLVLTFAAKDIAVTSILLLSWADTAASTVGRAFGKYTPQVAKGKSLAGSLASFLVGVLSCYLFYGYLVPRYHIDSPGNMLWTPETSQLSLHVFALATGFIASFSEAIDLAGLDDNFTIPVLSSVFLSALVHYFHI
ncbi:hypothetical protein OXX80_000039 [Metschnikowia pulcherrima]